MKSKYLKGLPQYHFNRNEFIDIFQKVFSSTQIIDLEILCQEYRTITDFILYYNDGEYYIIHLVSGTIINWYKHLGRTNTCNKEGFELNDLHELLNELKENLKFLLSESEV